MLEDFSNYSLWQTLLMVAVLFFFVVFLYTRYWQRYIAPYISSPSRPGQAIDVTPMADRLQQVRNNYSAALPNPSRRRRSVVLNLIRQSIRKLTFFRHLKHKFGPKYRH